ncbi:hypothetical protein Pfo_024721 [Paulownia fortunei]|nr:hypothetical protein Pfo_024721 [Paulownia fortunei]
MKRVNEIVEGASENLGLKKVRFFNGIDESCGALDRNEGEEHRVFVENGGIDSAQVDKNGGLFGNIVPDDLDGPSLGSLKESNIWDFDINFDLIFGNEEERKGLVFDLNLPMCRTQNGGTEKGCLEYNQGPMINENKVEIIDIASDDSDNEVEIVGYTCGYNAKGKQIELGMPYDRMENLSLGLGIIRMDNVVGESSLVTGGERRYTREEKGKANVVDSWLSLEANCIDLDWQTDSDESIRTSEPAEDVEIGTWQPEAVAARSELAERALRQAEQALRNRNILYREAWRETAKRFARINYPDQNNGNESSSQKQQSSTLIAVEQLRNSPGPFSEALKIVRERTSKRAAQQLIEWKPSKENLGQSITAPFVPSLLDISMRALAENAEGIVSLELVPDNLRGRLTNVLCDISKMNVHIMNLLVEKCPTEIRIKNCSWLTEKQFQQTFGNCQKKYLRVLQLDLCGQCMLDFAFRDTLAQSSNSFSSLSIVSLRGACRLSDSGLKDLVMSAPALRSINLGQCTLLTCDAITFIADSLGSNLRELYIDDCQKINAMLILPAFKKFKYLEVLSVAGIRTITDLCVSEMITVCGRSIKELDLANCLELTDCSLKTIGSNCAGLCSLNISNLHNLTDLGMEYLANGCKSIRKLKLCRNEFSDEAMAAFLESSGESLTELLLNNMTKVGPNTALSLAKRSRKLLSLDVSWCRRISNEALGLIVDSCSSLKLLKVFGCRQITNVFLNGHSNPLVRIIGLNLTPILDHVNLFEPEEVLLRYSPLPICMEV